jgi:hypothetical protein
MADPAARQAARIATAVSVPVVLMIALGSVWAFGGFSSAAPAKPSTATPTSSSQVTVPARDLATNDVGVCRQLIASLPAGVGSRARRPVTGPEQNAAYGDPPLTVQCGVPAPSVAPSQELYLVSGVCWATQTSSTQTVWTTVDRIVPISVTIPGGPTSIVAAFSAAITGNVPVAANVPSGCTTN